MAGSLRRRLRCPRQCRRVSQVGPPTLHALADLLVRNAARSENDPEYIPWLARLVKTRVIVMLPISNAIGYVNRVREELLVDPNRDFPYATRPEDCMVTIVARAINEVWLEHIFQLSITFHGGMQAIAYEWGSPNHMVRCSCWLSAPLPGIARTALCCSCVHLCRNVAHELCAYGCTWRSTTMPLARASPQSRPTRLRRCASVSR